MNDLVFVSDYSVNAEIPILLEKNILSIDFIPYKRKGKTKWNNLEHIWRIKLKNLSREMWIYAFKDKNFKPEINYQIENLMKICLRILKEKPVFASRHLHIREITNYYGYLVISQTFYSFLKQQKYLDNDFFDVLFVETVENKKVKEKELKELYDKMIRLLHKGS